MYKGFLSFLLFTAISLAGNAEAKFKKWSRYTSDNFTIYTDIGDRKTNRLINRFEDFHELVLAATGTAAAPDSRRMEIFVFDRTKDFERLAPREHLAGFYTHTAAGPRIVMTDGSRGMSGESVLFHEYVHHIMRGDNRFNYPMWYDEGLAEVLGATEFKRGEAVLGAIPVGRAWDLQSRRSLSVADLLKPDQEETDHRYWARFYAEAWLFVHYLQISTMGDDSGLRHQTQNYLSRYSRGEDPIEAFSSSYGVTPEEMDEQLEKYQRQRRIRVLKLKIPKQDRQVTKSALSKNESVFALAELSGLLDKPDLALELLEELDREETDSARGLSLQALLMVETDPDTADQLIKQAILYAPRDPRVVRNTAMLRWIRYEGEANEGATPRIEELKAMEKMLLTAAEQDPNDIAMRLLLWNISEEMDEPVTAAKHMMAAYRLDHTNIQLNFEIGAFLLRQQKPELALEFLERVHQWTHDGEVKSSLEELLVAVREAISSGETVILH